MNHLMISIICCTFNSFKKKKPDLYQLYASISGIPATTNSNSFPVISKNINQASVFPNSIPDKINNDLTGTPNSFLSPNNSQQGFITQDYNTPSLFDYSNTILIERYDEKEQILNFELYSKSWYRKFILKLPMKIRKKFILAKVGVRTYSSSGEMMDGMIANIFGDRFDRFGDSCHSGSIDDENDYDEADSYSEILNTDSNQMNDSESSADTSLMTPTSATSTPTATPTTFTTTNIPSTSSSSSLLPTSSSSSSSNTISKSKITTRTRNVIKTTTSTITPHFSIGLFVYMWVKPKLRGLQVGDYLLNTALEYCRKRGDQYILLVHDDTGSGKLIDYYKTRGFVPIFDFIDQGMICKINVVN